MAFTAWSNSLKAGNTVPNKYIFSGMGCSGNNISPPLEWKDAPVNTKSFAVTVFDPDTPKIGGWWHWAVINIPANISVLPEGASNNNLLPAEAIEVETDFGEKHYAGPCPPQGDTPHHYVFTVYALKNKAVHLSPNSTPGSIRHDLEHAALAKSSFTVHYGR
ncbi:MAG: YbhB/YbcL family Raf kinase inhibitor-like protein [Bacteriovorax sp.]|nr:YbhB/YbcL family Raf kinase inhibitor-like protein [Bacteriovorax sp.]